MAKMKRIIACPLAFVLFFGLVMQSINAQSKRSFEPSIQAFKTFYEERLQHHGIVGSSFFLVHDNQIVARDVYGLANREKNQAVDEETIFHWASITKTFTGIAIMQLRDRRLLKLDDPVVKYLPELRAVHDPFGDVS